jgi:hypothetical protein
MEEEDATKKYLRPKIRICTATNLKNTYFASLVNIGGHPEASDSARSVHAQGGMGGWGVVVISPRGCCSAAAWPAESALSLPFRSFRLLFLWTDVPSSEPGGMVSGENFFSEW